MVYRKFLRKKNNYEMFYLNLWSSWNWVSCGESWKPLLPIFLTDFGGFLVCCYKAIQQLNGVEKNSVAISFMLNHNLTGLVRPGFKPATSCSADRRSPNWANQAAVTRDMSRDPNQIFSHKRNSRFTFGENFIFFIVLGLLARDIANQSYTPKTFLT